MGLKKQISEFFSKDRVVKPPFDYDFLRNLDEKEYSKCLAKLFKFKTGEKLPFSRKLRIENGELRINYTVSKLKTFNQKIQWIKLYGVTDLMRNCTDKVKVRDYVRERLDESYLKPVLQIISRHCEA